MTPNLEDYRGERGGGLFAGAKVEAIKGRGWRIEQMLDSV